MWSYRARLDRVIDGDTIDLTIDLGFDVFKAERVRLIGLDAPEMGTPEGAAAKVWVIDWFESAAGLQPWPYAVMTRKALPSRDKYGRWVADIRNMDAHLNADMLAAGHATVWPAPSTERPTP